MSKHRIGVISDTHNMLRPEVIDKLEGCELIIHAGDVTTPEILDKLNKIAKVIAVKGNCDKAFENDLPESQIIDLYGHKIFIIHDKSKLALNKVDADMIIFGHSHLYDNFEDSGVIWLNPGSCGARRFGRPISMAILEFNTDNNSINIEKIDLTEEITKKQKVNLNSKKVLNKIEKIIKLLKKEKTVEEIEEKTKIKKDLIKQVCQIYYTHPGISHEEILNKIEIQDL